MPCSDQTCEDVFSCEVFFRVLGKSGCTAVFSVVRPHLRDILVPGVTKRARTFFLVRSFFVSSGNVCLFVSPRNSTTRNSSVDEIANVNFLYDDIVHAIKMQ